MASASGADAVAALPTVLRIDVRRAASWIALAAAVITGWGLASEERPFRVAAAIACGGLLAVAAIGRPPRGVPGGGRTRWAAVVWLRAGWAGVGFLVAGVAAAAAGSGAGGPAVCGIATAFAVAAAALVAVPAGVARPAAAETSLALLAGGVAAAVATAATVVGAGPLVATASGTAAWGLLVASRGFDPVTPSRDWLGGSTQPLRAAEPKLGIAMATALVAMAVCFFLAPQIAWAYSVLAVGWLVCLAAPVLADQTGTAAANRLTRSAAGRPLTPGRFWRTATTVGRAVAVLAWPAVVALVLTTIGVWSGEGPVRALAWIASAAGLILLVAAAADGRGETAQAVILALAAGAAVFAG